MRVHTGRTAVREFRDGSVVGELADKKTSIAFGPLTNVRDSVGSVCLLNRARQRVCENQTGFRPKKLEKRI